MRTLVTGGAGFIGSHLVEALCASGDEVVVIDNMSTGRRENLSGVTGTMTIIEDDLLTMPDDVLGAIVGGVDRIFHLASVVGVRLYVEHPVLTIQSVIRGTERLLDQLVAHPGKPMLVTSTSEAYGKSADVPMVEDGDVVFGPPTKPRWSYGMAKALDEQLCLGYAGLMGVRVKIVRLFNVVGPRQSGAYGMVMPRFVEQALNGDPITVYGDGEQTRSFTYVSDIVHGLQEAMHRPETDGVVMNLGSDEEVSINALAERVKVVTGSTSGIVHIPYHDAYGDGFEDIRRRVPNVERAREVIGFRVTKDLDGIVREIVRWKQSERNVEGAVS